jgi:hypothetical protein
MNLSHRDSGVCTNKKKTKILSKFSIANYLYIALFIQLIVNL